VRRQVYFSWAEISANERKALAKRKQFDIIPQALSKQESICLNAPDFREKRKANATILYECFST
jgi:hypothetical protein